MHLETIKMIAILIGLVFHLCLGLVETNQTQVEVYNFFRDSENVFKCGPNGYFLNTGIKYYNRFYDSSTFITSVKNAILLDTYNNFDANGKNLIKCARECVFNSLRNFLEVRILFFI